MPSIGGPAWDPDLYHRFQEERFAPIDDLLKLIEIRPGLSAVDLGSGTGELSGRLARALPNANVLGIDPSPAMLARASAHTAPGLRFESARIEDLTGTWDLVFSNAAIHWVDDHETLLPGLWALVEPGGQLVVQLPSNHDHVSQRVIREIAAENPHRSALGGWSRTPSVLSANRYAEILYDLGGERITVFEKVYPHVLPDSDSVIDWMRGTTLRPYLSRLDPAQAEAYLDACRDRLRKEMPGEPVFFGFRRILFCAAK